MNRQRGSITFANRSARVAMGVATAVEPTGAGHRSRPCLAGCQRTYRHHPPMTIVTSSHLMAFPQDTPAAPRTPVAPTTHRTCPAQFSVTYRNLGRKPTGYRLGQGEQKPGADEPREVSAVSACSAHHISATRRTNDSRLPNSAASSRDNAGPFLKWGRSRSKHHPFCIRGYQGS